MAAAAAAETLRAFLVWNLQPAASRVGAKSRWSLFFENPSGRTSKNVTPIDYYVRRNDVASLAATCHNIPEQQFQFKQQPRNFWLVCGAEVQDDCATTLVESPWRWIQKPSVSSHWQTRRLSHSSAWTSVESSEAQAIEQLWQEYSADPSQWWDNRTRKRSPRSPDFRHRVTREVLWLDGWSTPTWVKTRFAEGSRLHNGVPADSRKIGESAKTLAEAISVLKNRQDQGSYIQVLKWCWKEKDVTAVKQVHDIIVQNKMEQNVFLANNLLMTYIGCGRMFEARQVFDQLVKKDLISWNVMIGGYTGEDAMKVFNQMRQEGAEPNEITYLNILKACVSSSAGKEVHECIRQSGFEADVRVGTAILQMYVECSSIGEARQVFDAMKERNVITWTAMIGAYAKSNSTSEAYQLFRQMIREGFKPNAHTYTNILNTPASLGAVREVHRHAQEAGLETDLRVGNALVHTYSKSGSLHEARLVFDRMKERDVITWTALIGGLAQHGHGHEAYRLLLKMEQEPGFKPNAITYTSILQNAGDFELVKKIHKHASKAGFDSDMRVGSALIHMYSKSGCIDDARLVFSKLQKRDAVTYTAMIGGLAQHGCGQEALKLFRGMEVEPIETTFLAVLSACSHAGLVNEGRQIFKEMTGFKPMVLHYNCMVDLLGRAGHLAEAKLFIQNMSVEPDEGTWGALLSACRTHGNIELGELAATERLKVLPSDASTYVLLSNMYAAAGKWEKVSVVRRLMQERGIRKQPGRSWIVVDNKVHDFVASDRSHPESAKIYAELNLLTERIKAAGYVPDTRLVLKNIDEEDKELALCSHSEKLAIVYGLMRAPGEEPIVVYKNLRVCSDCHEATKFISKVTERQIVVRDGNRFHHFKHGRCSCGGYW